MRSKVFLLLKGHFEVKRVFWRWMFWNMNEIQSFCVRSAQVLYADLPVMIKYFPLQQQLWLYTKQWQLVSSTLNSGPGKLPISVGEETVISVKFSTLQWKAATVVLLWMKRNSTAVSLLAWWSLGSNGQHRRKISLAVPNEIWERGVSFLNEGQLNLMIQQP